MKWLLVFCFVFPVQAQQVLKHGVYRNLKPTQPLILRTGSFIFIGLEMTSIITPLELVPPRRVVRGPELAWLDGRKADTVRFINCRFTGITQGLVLRLGGTVFIDSSYFDGTDWQTEALLKGSKPAIEERTGIEYNQGNQLSITHSLFQNLNTAVVFSGNKAQKTGANTLRENTFINNGTNLLFRSTYKAGYKLDLKCNRFTTPTSPAPFAMRYGIYVEAGAGMPDIGGTGVDDNPSPAGNWWPSNGTTNSLLSPWPATLNSTFFSVEHWRAPTGWENVKNLTQNEWKYYRYINEYLGPFSNPINQPSFQRITVPRLIVSRVNIPIPGTNQNYPNQVNPQNSGMEMDVACSNFGAVLVFPTRKAVAEDSMETKIETRHSQTLEQNVPNPANNSTRIGFTLPEDAKFSKLEVFELTTGRIVKSIGLAISGKGHVEFGLSGFAAGIYGYRLICNGRDIGHKKMIVVK
jgi:hypothetical protein